MNFLYTFVFFIIFFVCDVYAIHISPVTSNILGFDKKSVYLMKNAMDAVKECDWILAEYYVRKTQDEDMDSLVSWFRNNYDQDIKYIKMGIFHSSIFSNCDQLNTESSINIPATLLKDGEYISNKENENYMNILHKNAHINESQILRIIKISKFDLNMADAFLIWADNNLQFHYAVKLLQELPNDIKYKKKIIDHKMRLIREVLYSKRKNLYNEIYQLSIDHQYSTGVLFAESEWLSGWIAISFLKNKELAIMHFTKLFYSVKTPISIARAAYWIGRVYEIYGDVSLSKKWYKIGANYGKTFHGQVSSYKIQSEDKLKIDVGKLKKNIHNISEEKKKEYDLYLKYVYIMALLNETKLVSFWVDKLLSSSEGAGYSIPHLINISKLTAMPYVSLYALKYIERVYGVVEYEHSFPILYIDYVNTIDQKNSIFRPVCYGLMRQESEFNILAISHAGAVGLMQVMPFTAELMIKKLGLKSEYIDLQNPKHSILLGGNFLSQLMNKYNNSVVLSVAAYNAGDIAVEKWIKKIGDIRDVDNIDDCIDWIENIPYKETRQYVFRVIENARVYEKIINQFDRQNKERSIYDFVVCAKSKSQ